MMELAQRSGELIRPYFANPGLVVDTKADKTPVTKADRDAEALMREAIRQRFPEHGVLGEEYGPEKIDAEYVWVLDPIDGTKAFATAVPLFGTLIALLHQGRPVLGAINNPVLNWLCIGDGESTTLNGAQVRVRECTELSQATLLISAMETPSQYQDGAAFEALRERVRLYRTWGDCYGYMLLSTGWADIMCDPVLSPWDVAALVPVARGAGGVITTWQGDEPVVDLTGRTDSTSLLAAGPGLHAQVVAALNP
jgi:myo-inositol-1(or 4)-monophosphatase